MASGQNGPFESGGGSASNPDGGAQTTGFPSTPHGEAVSETRKNSQETVKTGYPTVLDDTDPDFDNITTGYVHLPAQPETRPGSPSGVPGAITNLSYDHNPVLAPNPTRVGTKRQQYSQNPNKG